jgi:hypothetical protein
MILILIILLTTVLTHNLQTIPGEKIYSILDNEGKICFDKHPGLLRGSNYRRPQSRMYTRMRNENKKNLK